MGDDATEDATDDAVSTSESTPTPEPTPVGVKLGSTRTVAAFSVEGNPTVARSLTCLATYEDALTGDERVLYGEEAAVEYPDRVRYMLRSGLPEDDENAELAARFFEAFVGDHDLPADSAVVYAIPTIDNESALANLQSVIESSTIGEVLVRSYPESLCGAVPAMGDGLEAIDSIFIGINLGSTNLEACAYRRGEQLAPFATGAVTGNEVDRRIATYVEDETQGRVNIDRTTAREYKEEHANFLEYEPFTDVIQQPGGGSHEFTIERSVMDAVDEYVDQAVDTVANDFLPELANDHMKVYQLALDEPIVITGGMACIPGLVDTFEQRLSEELDREVTTSVAEEPDLAAAQGAHRIAERLLEAQ